MRIINILTFPIWWVISPFTNLFTNLFRESSIADLKTFSYTKQISFLQILLLGGMIAFAILNPLAGPLALLIIWIFFIYITMPLIKTYVAMITLAKALTTFVDPFLKQRHYANITQGFIFSALEIGFLGKQPCPFFSALFYNPSATNPQDKNQFLLNLISPINIAHNQMHEGCKEENTRQNLLMFLSLFYSKNNYSDLATIAEDADRNEENGNRVNLISVAIRNRFLMNYLPNNNFHFNPTQIASLYSSNRVRQRPMVTAASPNYCNANPSQYKN